MFVFQLSLCWLLAFVIWCFFGPAMRNECAGADFVQEGSHDGGLEITPKEWCVDCVCVMLQLTVAMSQRLHHQQATRSLGGARMQDVVAQASGSFCQRPLSLDGSGGKNDDNAADKHSYKNATDRPSISYVRRASIHNHHSVGVRLESLWRQARASWRVNRA